MHQLLEVKATKMELVKLFFVFFMIFRFSYSQVNWRDHIGNIYKPGEELRSLSILDLPYEVTLIDDELQGYLGNAVS